MVWAYAGDALWVIALTIMFGASRQASGRIPADTRVPLMGARLPRGLALWALPGGAFLFSLWFAAAAREHAYEGDVEIIFFGLRALSASLLALLHLRWLGDGLKALERDGALRS